MNNIIYQPVQYFNLGCKDYIVTVDNGTAETKNYAASVGSNDSIGGYVTELNLTGTQQTDKWQGYYGNVSGTIKLSDSNGYTMESWDAASPVGEVYAIVSGSLPASWAAFATGTVTLTDLDTAFGIDSSALDGAVETFTVQSSTFDLAGTAVTQSNRAVKTDGAVVDDATWETVALYDGDGTTQADYLFAGIINQNQPSFKSQEPGVTDLCDFQMIVPEDPDSGATTYYFYMEMT